ncbi:MAG: hypothetical protein J6M66_05700 [Lachnospiraceae bacterium]|nr:hypothetical protein [Lachnospiraceae bacterium]
MKKATARTTIVIVLLVVAVVGYYAYLANKSKESKAEASMTVVETTLSRDLTKDYPPTPKEVIKYYNEILRCLYNEDSTEEEVGALVVKMRELYDDDLLAVNELGTQHMLLQAEIDDWKKNGRRYISFNPASSTDVDTYEHNGYSCAKLTCGYAIMQDGRNYQLSLIYVLRKDADKHWKILGWRDDTQTGPGTE